VSVSGKDQGLRLNLISTYWSVVNQAHGSRAEAARSARGQLLEHYEGAVRRYLRGALRDEDAAADVFQEFALCLVRGDLHGADPCRGRFRDYVKGVLSHLVADYHKRQHRWPRPLPGAGFDPTTDVPAPDPDRQFVESWRDELLARSWAALAEVERRMGRPFYAVLRFRADHPEMHSPQLAEHLSSPSGRPLTAAGVRQLLHRAREKFAELLLDEVSRSLQTPTAYQLEQELSELGLLDYCRAALERCRRPAAPLV
jgi:DNA-directed RNA polymerase specialized sigma24 family protein